jgi:hypothetical protein
MPARPAFSSQTITLRPEQLSPRKIVSAALKHTAKYRQIKASLEKVGLIEPLVVYPLGGDLYQLLDGHVRAIILQDLGVTGISCLIATEQEAYNYNKRVNELTTVQEHHMILKAIRSGVSEERIAAVLHVNVTDIRQKRDLLNGICPEVAEILKHRDMSVDAFKVLKKMTACRQVEAADLMNSASNYSISFAKALLAATKPEDLVDPSINRGVPKEQAARMEQELSMLQHNINSIKGAPFGVWLTQLTSRSPQNVVVVALANKLVRTAWAVLFNNEPYRSPMPTAA